MSRSSKNQKKITCILKLLDFSLIWSPVCLMFMTAVCQILIIKSAPDLSSQVTYSVAGYRIGDNSQVTGLFLIIFLF